MRIPDYLYDRAASRPERRSLAVVRAGEYEGLEQLREHVQASVQSYNFGKHLKALRWKTPFRAICEAWEKDPSRFRLHPYHLTVGLNI